MGKRNYKLFGDMPVSPVIDFYDNKAELVNFFATQAYTRTQSLEKFDGLPETIEPFYFKLWLQRFGYVVITYVSKADMHGADYPEGYYAFSRTGCGLGGEPDNNYMPTEAVINNPALNFSVIRKIGEDCALIRNDPMMAGISGIVTMYANLLAESAVTLRMNGINSRIPWFISSADDAVEKAAQLMMDDIERGRLKVITDSLNMISDQPGSLNIVQNGGQAIRGITDLIEYHQYLKASLLNDLGINANFNMKREALNSSESALNTQALLPFIDTMLKTQKHDIDKCNELFGLNITVDYDSVWKTLQEVEKDASMAETPQAPQDRGTLDDEGNDSGSDNV